MTNGPTPSERSQSKGSLAFRGYRWLCPRCGRKVNLLYLPLRPMNLIESCYRVRGDYAAFRALIQSAGDAGKKWCVTQCGVTAFQCERCVKLRRFSRCDANGWNEIITHLTGGLLYGREVKRPDWFTPDRKLPHTPRPTRSPSVRRPQVERLLLAGRTFKQIAAELGLAYGTILWTAQQVYKQHGVRSLHELLLKHGHALVLTKKEVVRERIAAGETIPQIASAMRLPASSIYNHVYMLRRSGLIPARQRKSSAPALSPRS